MERFWQDIKMMRPPLIPWKVGIQKNLTPFKKKLDKDPTKIL